MGTLPIAARREGVLANSDGSGMDVADLQEITRIGAADLESGFSLLLKIGWITMENSESATNLPPICHQSASRLPENSGFVKGEGEEEGEGEDISPENDGAKPSLPRKKYSDGFELFWKAYKRPDKGSKKSASNQWKSKRLEGRESELIAKADQYAKSVDDPKYMKHAERFLSNELYENEYTPSGKGQSEIEARMFKPMKPRDQTASIQSAYEVGPDGEEL